MCSILVCRNNENDSSMKRLTSPIKNTPLVLLLEIVSFQAIQCINPFDFKCLMIPVVAHYFYLTFFNKKLHDLSLTRELFLLSKEFAEI